MRAESARATFERGQDTLRVSYELHRENRARAVEAMRARGDGDGVVAMTGGRQTRRYSTDNEPLFRQESYFHWMFGALEGDCHGALDARTGKSTLFVPRLPEEYAIWMGAIETRESFAERYLVDEVMYADEFEGYLKALDTKIYVLKGVNSDSGDVTDGLGAELEAALGATKIDATDALFNVITELRTVKTAREQEVLKYASKISSMAHVEVIRSLKPGMMEYQLESLFKHTCYSRGGMRNESYTSICAAGKNGATLHYGHAGAPNSAQIKEGDLVLMDMGAEYHCYAADITTTVPAGGKFTPDAKIIYEGVLAAHQAVLKALKPGCAWLDLQRLAETHILRALVDGGFLVGDIDEMMAKRVSATFMPHGLGHHLGVDTHDVGGYGLPGTPARSTEPGLKNCRTASLMKEGNVMTIEPGCYFIDVLLDRALADGSDIKQYFVADRVNACRSMGGVRLEDNVVVTADGCQSWTSVPRTVAEVEAVMAGASWP
jgi:Xaa-Pro dipeptidase